MTHIPLVDLPAQHREIAAEIEPALTEVMRTGAFIGGKPVALFEQEYADFLGVGHCVGVGNGTDALEIALRALRIGAGDEVVLPANTFIATAEAVVRAGARPVLVDVDPATYLIDSGAAVAAIGPRTRAVIPVHLYGQVAPVEELLPAAAAAGVAVVEDAAQSQGATRHGRHAGTFGAVAGTSFYPGKNLGAYGDAGAVLTSSAQVAAAARTIGSHGSDRKYVHSRLGVNSRLDTLQAVVLRAKLARLAAWNTARVDAAARYDEFLADLADAGAVTRPVILPGNTHVWHLYVIEVDNRDTVLERLHGAGIGAGIHYPIPVHRQEAFVDLGYALGAFPVSERAAERILSLPLYPQITADQQSRVADELRRALR
ncbi:DegT/DnrJ/EryC1/StrS family aminotransferase [Protofrankia symbiont of Coriaria ruscifolia]|uniref:DegT/DnrJ/EryC1/StrS family aminotransferase n=1 Tax=Protofrankia symbiont of Coriaria ruscifolia TaxID=1306542 RepID=UPI0010412CE4|nr:DegT/DnrJ/EryC1/StrS family aminotransferase [Protofrankia symbiont of Coriaria ruscifolia]